jgi:hypothetical protein
MYSIALDTRIILENHIMEILLVAGILFLGSQLRPTEGKTEEQKKREKETEDLKLACQDFAQVYCKHKYQKEAEDEINKRISSVIK